MRRNLVQTCRTKSQPKNYINDGLNYTVGNQSTLPSPFCFKSKAIWHLSPPTAAWTCGQQHITCPAMRVLLIPHVKLHVPSETVFKNANLSQKVTLTKYKQWYWKDGDCTLLCWWQTFGLVSLCSLICYFNSCFAGLHILWHPWNQKHVLLQKYFLQLPTITKQCTRSVTNAQKKRRKYQQMGATFTLADEIKCFLRSSS